MNVTLHEHFIRRCFDLAKRGIPHVRTNPLVGACLVHQDRIISEGFHHSYGAAHAEVNAIDAVKEGDRDLLKDSTLYVSLEPCSHHGKTPPCTDVILRAGIPRVVISLKDPNPVAGGGLEELTSKGVSVETGILEADGKELNKAFLTGLSRQQPYVTLKWAQSSDGFIGKREERITISGRESRLFVHDLRRNHNAILVGSGTVITDNPLLTTRSIPGENPLRVVVKGKRPIPASHQVLTDGEPTLIYQHKDSTDTSIKEDENIHIQHFNSDIDSLLHDLYQRHNIGSVLVEGGQNILDQFIVEGLWNKAIRITSPLRLKEGLRSPDMSSFEIRERWQLGPDSIEVFDSPL